ncbi:MarR family transcriptional regulator [Nocardioides sp. CFH 31398]|uniref:SCO6745 family protein n=1 Tax=Nocardioides sp. CFH 31398 TaxID=2919579 RepID=UPI001F05B953|nr:MarR family transcriptional regulator [Nocardioides sp. CFH 31398]MCH1865330.1 MarR family transcriptional regulator [Nocardioides sp. CFH 31398]
MDYADARAAFFAPREGEAHELDWHTPARRLRDAMEAVAMCCYWGEPAYDALAAHGLDFLTGYVWGRGSQLGEPEGEVVAAAFGVFEPGLVRGVWDDARSRCSLAEIRAARVEGVTATLTAACGEPGPEVRETADALLAAGAGHSMLGRPFYAGLHALDVPDEPWARLWHACTVLREHRGDAHLTACVGAGLDGVTANMLTELWVGWEPDAYTGTRGWSPEVMAAGRRSLEERGLADGDTITPAGRTLRDGLEATTDASEQPVVDRLGSDLDPLAARVRAWSDQVVAAGWFPPDPYKHAAG